MKALTLWQPWATLVALGLKRYETRGWTTLYRGPLAIHAAKTRKGIQVAGADVLELVAGETMLFGSVVAVCDFDGVVETDGARGAMDSRELLVGDWGEGRHAWRLSRVAPLRAPLYIRGRQGLWSLDEDSARTAIKLTRTRRSK